MNTFLLQTTNHRISDVNARELLFKQFSKDRDFSGGLTFYRSIISATPQDHYYGGTFLLVLDQFEEAEVVLGLALDHGYFHAIAPLSSLYRRNNRPDKAVALLEAFKNTVLPEYTKLTISYEYGCLLREAGMVATALKHLARAWVLANKPENSRALVTIGIPYAWTLSHAGQDEHALDALETIASHPNANQIEIQSQRVRSLMRLGRFDEATSVLNLMEPIATSQLDLFVRVETSKILLAIALCENKQADALIAKALQHLAAFPETRLESRFYIHLSAVWAGAERWDEQMIDQEYFAGHLESARRLSQQLGPRERAYFGYRAGCYIGRCQEQWQLAAQMLETAAAQFERLAAYREAALCWLNAADMHGRANQWKENPESTRCLENAETFLAQTNSYGAMREVHDHTAICRWAFKHSETIFGQMRAQYCQEVEDIFMVAQQNRQPTPVVVPTLSPEAAQAREVPYLRQEDEREQGRRYLVIMALGASGPQLQYEQALLLLRGQKVPESGRNELLMALEQTCLVALDHVFRGTTQPSSLLLEGITAFIEVAPQQSKVLGGLLLLLHRYQGREVAQTLLEQTAKRFFGTDSEASAQLN
jgi:tetratricopeptide (TPR) repeat protein